ncbi:unnamed protein product, partial [Laminaria digitata]
PRRPPSREPIASPRRERDAVTTRVVERRRAPPFGDEPGDRKAFSPKKGIPACLLRQARPALDVEGVEWGGEVGYTISSQYKGAPKCRGFEGGGCTPTVVPLVAPRSEVVLVSSPPPEEVLEEKEQRPADLFRVPKIPVDRAVVLDVQSLLPSSCVDQHIQKQQMQQQQIPQQQQQQRCGGICCPSRPRSAPLFGDSPLHTSSLSISEDKTRPQEDHQEVCMSVKKIARRRPRSRSFDASTDGDICGMSMGPSSDSRAQRQRPHSARARYLQLEDAMDHPRQIFSKEGDSAFNRDPHTSNFVANASRGGSSVKLKNAESRGGATDKGVDLGNGSTGSPATVSSSLDALADRTNGGPRFSAVGKVDSSTTLADRNLTPARGVREGDRRGSATPRERDAGGKGVAATARGKKKWTMPTKDEVVRWGRDIDRLLRIRATRVEGETMMAVN